LPGQKTERKGKPPLLVPFFFQWHLFYLHFIIIPHSFLS